MSLRHTTAGNSRWWESRPSDHVRGNRMHWHGKILPLEEEPGFFRKLFGRG